VERLPGVRSPQRKEIKNMQVIHARCAGLDVHKKTVVACVWLTADNGRASKETRTFGTTTGELLALCDWLKTQEVAIVAMEATGVYWWPIYNVFEGAGIEALVVNAHHVKALPGRKTDVADAEWIGDLLRHGLVRGSFVPPRPQRELRELTRHRAALVAQRVIVIQELHRVLEGTNIKLGSVVSDISGVSAGIMLRELVAGRVDPATLAELARGRLRSKRTQLEAALVGVVGAHHRLILGQLLADLELFDEQILAVGEELERRLNSEQELIERLDEIPGVNRRVAEVILAEVGTDLSRFPTDGHLISWAGLCPGQNQSAGKTKSRRLRKGNRALKQTLVEAAHGAARTTGYFGALFRRLTVRRGGKRAILAVARSLLVTAYHMIARGTHYQDLGADYFDRLQAPRIVARLSARLKQLGFAVTPDPTFSG
jgi:transposase